MSSGIIKIKAGALQFATMISVLIAILLLSFILLTDTHNRFSKELEDATTVMNLSRDGVLSFQYQSDLAYGEWQEIILEHAEGASQMLKRKHWGVFDLISSQASKGSKTHQKIALVGSKIEKNQRPVLYLQDENKPLVVVGKTLIRGKAYLSSQGIKAGNIAGNYYQGERLVYGEKYVSKVVLPTLANLKRVYLSSLIDKLPVLVNDSLFIEKEVKFVSNSFDNPTQWIMSFGDINISGRELKGNIIVKSNTRISVSSDAIVENIILIAPIVEIKDNVVGSMQIIANKNIAIGEGTVLNYPSSLTYIIDDKKKNGESEQKNEEGIKIRQNVQVHGCIISLGKREKEGKEATIQLDAKSTIVGEVYSEELVQIKGEVHGSVYTKGFLSKEKGSVYLNHLFDAQLDSSLLAESYVGLPLDGFKKSVVQWVE